ncbi:flavin reductase family protein [Streptomyces coeruleorubidus]|uniref:flavin reductase family protein n=1 Tax=Streptomyces coeruleorubidus TaxID=116188 RepID=UPI0033A9EB71
MSSGYRGPSGGTQERADIDPACFRDVLGRFCSGITAVTATVDGRPVGLTCQSFMSMSLEPPLVAFAPAVTSTSYPLIREAGHFAVGVLAEDQADVATAFSRSGGDKFTGRAWHHGVTGAPLLDGAIAHIECELVEEYAIGDHLLVVGRVMALSGHPDAAPLLYFRGAFGALSAGHRTRPSPVSR